MVAGSGHLLATVWKRFETQADAIYMRGA